MRRFVLFSIIIALAVCKWKLFIPASWYEPRIGDIENVLSSNGYLLETHQVTTEDGYILTLHRIPNGHNEKSTKTKRKPPAFVMHGLLSSSVDWVINGPEKSMGLILADAGYDVWIGNNRGNTYSKGHVSLNPNIQKKEYFDYSYHEIGLYDLPAMIDYVLNTTQHKKLTYLGFSEGFTSFLVMGSLRPEYNEKILIMNAFAPVTNMFNITSYVFNILAHSPSILATAEYIGWYEFLSHDDTPLLRFICTNAWPLCRELFLIVGTSKEQAPSKEFQIKILANSPAGASLKQFAHYVQGTRTGIFGQFDYGQEENLKIYGRSEVPLYNLTKVTAPIIMYYGEKDCLINNDILLNSVAKELPNVVKIFRVSDPNFNHMDFIWGKEINQLTEEALKNINNYNKNS